MLRMRTQTCERCGHKLESRGMVRSFVDALSHKRSALESALQCRCPHCGHEHPVTTKPYFFGLVGPRVLWWIVMLVVVGVGAVTFYQVIVRDLNLV